MTDPTPTKADVAEARRIAEQYLSNVEPDYPSAVELTIDAIATALARVRADCAAWHSPYETPGFCGATARRVLVWLERRYNPPELNAPGRLAFGHCIPNPENPHWPDGGWFYDGQDRDYRVMAWKYADPPEPAAIRARSEPQTDEEPAGEPIPESGR